MAKVICCCGAKTWTQVFAWFQIITCIIAFVLVVIFTSIVVSHRTEVEQSLKEHDQVRQEFIGSDSGYQESSDWAYFGTLLNFQGIVAMMIVTAIILFLGLVFGIILLKGANQSKIRYLKLWIIHSLVWLIWSIVATAVRSGSLVGSAVFSVVIQAVLSCIFYGFQIWVVWTLIKEIQLESGLRHDDPKFNATQPIPD